MPGFPLPPPMFQEFDVVSGALVPLASGKLYAYAPGTTTPKDTYSDQALTTPNANPVVLDSSGRARVFIEDGELYRFKLKTSADVELYDVDNVSVPAVAAPPTAVVTPTGVIAMWGAPTAPTGFLLCDGSAVSRTTYADLFTVIGTTFGAGNGSTTFNLPDFRQRFPLGLASSGTGNSLGATGGTIDHTHTGPSHTHTVAAHSHTMAHTHSVPRDGWGSVSNSPGVTGRVQTGNAGGAGPDVAQYQATQDSASGASSAADTGTTALTSDAAGTGATGSANPPFVVVNFVIKT